MSEETTAKTLRVSRKAAANLLQAIGFKEVTKINNTRMAARLKKMSLYVQELEEGTLTGKAKELADRCVAHVGEIVVVHSKKSDEGVKTKPETTTKKVSEEQQSPDQKNTDTQSINVKKKKAGKKSKKVTKKTTKKKASTSKEKSSKRKTSKTKRSEISPAKEPRKNSELGVILAVLRKSSATKARLYASLRKTFPDKAEETQKRNLSWYLSFGCDSRGFPVEKDEDGKYALIN